MSKLYETSLPANFSKVLFDEKNLDLAPEHMDKINDVIFTGVANILKAAKSMEKPVAYTFRGMAKNFIAGAVVQYFPGEDAKTPGNWSLVWTFDEKDIPDNALQIDFSNAESHTYFRAAAGEKYGMGFKSVDMLVNTLLTAIEQIKKWLDENAKEGSEVSVEQEGVFQARVAIEGGEKVFAIEADGEIKNLIKDDTAIEK